MIGPMTDRGLPIVDGAPACPFVAFEDDRDGRALAPDHRHRCFAEARPAPRALAHQEAYCLSSAFPVCPTFQDWARREAAAARPGGAESPRPPRVDTPPPVPASSALPPRDREGRHAGPVEIPPIPPRRNPPRDWAAPPPWSGDDLEQDYGRPGSAWASGSQGLAGSAADRLAGPDPESPATPRPSRYAPQGAAEDDQPAWASAAAADDDDARAPEDAARRADGRLGADPHRAGPSHPGAGRAPAGASREPRRPQVIEPEELFGPAWERPRRFEAYPSLRTRVGLPSMGGVPRIGVAAIALVLAAVALFFIGPMLLGIGGKSPGTATSPTTSPVAELTPSPEITVPPAPTPQTYTVAKGDTMSKIAKKFGLTIEQLMAANPKVKNPDRIKEGQQLTIPAPEVSGATDSGGELPSP
jgi:nucleoid-associated protein YgaU